MNKVKAVVTGSGCSQTKTSLNNGSHPLGISGSSVTNLRHTGIVVSDMDRSLPFYRELLGMEVWADFVDDSPYLQTITGVPGAKVRMVKLRAQDGVSVELLQYLSHSRPMPPVNPSYAVGCSHVAFQVDDLNAMYAQLKARGVPFHAPPMISTDGRAKVTYCRDPEGVIIELVELISQKETI